MRFHYIIKSEGTLALFLGTITLSKGEREPTRHGPRCVNNGFPVPRPSWVGWRPVGGLCGGAESGTTGGVQGGTGRLRF